jgi:hypothetical protein
MNGGKYRWRFVVVNLVSVSKRLKKSSALQNVRESSSQLYGFLNFFVSIVRTFFILLVVRIHKRIIIQQSQ